MSEQAVAESGQTASSQPVIIDCKGLGKTYVSGKLEVHALRDVDLQVMRNEFVAIMGPSGSGKSTLMNLLGCLDTPSFGSYRLNQTESANLDDDELAAVRNQEIGFVFQTFNLLARATALHNVELPLIYAGMSSRKRHERAMNALERVNLGHRWDHRPNELSGGERQRVAVARALVNNPAIVLADEPTGNLDSRTSYEIMNLFMELHKAGQTIIIVTHEDDIARYAHRVVRVLDGNIVEDKRQTPVIPPPPPAKGEEHEVHDTSDMPESDK
ncbi:MAG: ABC transporter ATP-binding protein [Acidobacteriota bacterium]|nr:ABC transporter ATP-binding protein [Acidobacteriota bacterium]